jgi:hypothetical protein
MKIVSVRTCFCVLGWMICTVASLPAQTLWHDWLKPHRTDLPTARTAAIQVDYPMMATGFDWNEAQSKWDTVNQSTFSYVSTGGLLERILSDYASGSFVQDFRETHHYNVQGFDSLTLGEDWTGTAWEPSFQFRRTFDPFGNVTESMGYVWNGSSWDTSSGYRATFTYHDTSQIASVIQESYAAGTGWEADYKMEYSFDILDRWDTVTGYLPNSGNWVPDLRLVDIGWHDFSKNQPDSGRFEKYTTGWVNLERYHVTYGVNDNQVWTYEKYGTDWDLTEQFIFNYDSHGNEILNEMYAWIGIWHQEEGLISHRSYNPSDQMTEVWTELFDGYIYRYHDRYVFSNFFVGHSDPHNIPLQVLVFPNPATDAIHLQFEGDETGPVQVQLYDLMGRLRMDKALSRHGENVRIEIPQDWEDGTYICRIQTSKGMATRRIVLLQ